MPGSSVREPQPGRRGREGAAEVFQVGQFTPFGLVPPVRASDLRAIIATDQRRHRLDVEPIGLFEARVIAGAAERFREMPDHPDCRP